MGISFLGQVKLVNSNQILGQIADKSSIVTWKGLIPEFSSIKWLAFLAEKVHFISY